MAGEDNMLQDSYSFAVDRGFAVLSRMAGHHDAWPPPNTGNVNDDILLDAVYGGSFDPDVPGEYTVYRVDWLDELPGEEAQDPLSEIDEDELAQARELRAQRQRRRISGEPVEAFRRHLDDNFKGWLYHHGKDEVFVLAEASDEDQPSRFE